MYTIDIAQLITCQQAGMSSTETAKLLGVSQPAVAWRAARLKPRLVFTSKQGRGPKTRKWKTCQSCAHRKLCLLCHRLHVAALPCEADLLFSGHGEHDPYIWPDYYQKLTCQVGQDVVE